MSITNSFYGDSLERNKGRIAKDFISETTEVVQMIYCNIVGRIILLQYVQQI